MKNIIEYIKSNFFILLIIGLALIGFILMVVVRCTYADTPLGEVPTWTLPFLW